VALADRADRPGLHQLDDAAVVVRRVDLRAHLRRHARLRRGLVMIRASWTSRVSGFSQYTCFLRFSAGSVANACVCSGR
jgi:hypothetical protein